VIPPAIDPLSEKNVPISHEAIRQVLTRFNVDPERPLVLQASRMDSWKDPLGVLEAYNQIKHRVPGVQLVFLVAIANDDPEGWAYYDQTVAQAGGDPDVHILPNILNGIGDWEVNAFQTGAQVVVQKSLREGFGLSVTEALWKGRPVVGGKVGGIPLQVVHGRTGYLVSTPSECAKWILYLLQSPERADQLGQQGREHARRNFLITRYLRDYLRVFRALNRSKRKLYPLSHLQAVVGPTDGS
jgi:trehalose synthase